MSNPITPTVGRLVLFKSREPEHMGTATELPAIVTRVWSDACINVMLMRDGHGATPIGVSSVVYNDDFEASGAFTGWRWMDYQVAKAAEAAA